MKSYRDLEIYQVAKKLAIQIHFMTVKLPKFEQFEEGSQIRRSSKSVAGMIVEGFGRRKYKADFVKYLIYAHAECDETILHLEFLFETNSFTDKILYSELKNDYEQLSRRINKFIQWVELFFQPVQPPKAG